MDNPTRAINLIVVDPSSERVEGVARLLRNRGLAAHPQAVNEPARLYSLLSPDVDLIIYNADIAGMNIAEFGEIYRASGSRAPVIAVSEHPSAQLYRGAIASSIHDVVAIADIDHLELVVRRELGHLKCRRELDQTTRRLQALDKRCNTLITHSRDAICYLQEGVFTQVNASCLSLFGYQAADEITGLPLLDMIALEEQDRIKPLFRAIMLGQQSEAELTTRCLRRDGSEFDALLELTRFEIDGEPSVQLRIHKRRKPTHAEPLLSLEAHRDAETGLFNRAYFLKQLERRIDESDTPPDGVALLYIELDGFRQVRRQIGLAATDRLLKDVTRILLQSSRPEELLARVGDQSFVLLADRESAFAINTLAEEICRSIATTGFHDTFEPIQLTCSIGISLLAKAIRLRRSPFELAMRSCEAAEENGGNQFIFSAGDEDLQERDTIVPNSLIHSALEHDRFRLTYQPVVNLRGNSAETFLVMLRLLDDEENEIAAGDFLKQVEHAGLMDAVDRWVIEHSIMELARLHSQGRDVHFFVTLSSASLNDQDLPLWINEKLRQYGTQGAWLTFQMHEQDVRNSFDKAAHFFEDLKHIGCQLAIDRFGLKSGLESLVHHLNVDYVRLDPSFMKNLPEDENKQERLAQLQEQIQPFDVKVIAASVENARSLSILWKLGVNHIQGHFLQAPSPAMTYDFQYV